MPLVGWSAGPECGKIVKDSLTDLGLLLLWQNPDTGPLHNIENVDFTFMCEVNSVNYFSTIDHFACI